MRPEPAPAAHEEPGQSPALTVAGVSKTYRVYASPLDRLKRVLGFPSRWLERHALTDVTFSVARGEAVGIIGENGAGKSTLLKVVAGTTAPTQGHARVAGRVASILELGAAFHPEFSGRENAILYGALLGISRPEMEQRLERILEFSELGPVLHHPIRSYSTGMVMRLAFAVATHLEAEILVIDEALAVGDGYFQKKCTDRLLQIKRSGATVLFCSHSLYQVTMFCDRVLWLRDGCVEAEGPAKDVVEAYESYLLLREKRRLQDAPQEIGPQPVGRITEVACGEGSVAPGSALEVTVGIASRSIAARYHVGIALDTLDGRCLFGVTTLWDGRPPLTGSAGYRLRLRIPSLPISRGTFHLSAFLLDETGLHVHDQVAAPRALEVRSGDRWSPSLLEIDHGWEEG